MADILIKVEIVNDDGTTQIQKTSFKNYDVLNDSMLEFEIIGETKGGPFPRPAEPRLV